MYHLDVAALTMRHLTTVSRPNDSGDSIIKNGLLIIGWAVSGSYYLDIRKLPINANDVEETALVDLGSDMVWHQA